VSLPAGKALNGDMRGALLGHPFTAQLHAGALEPIMLQARAPLDFVLRSGTCSRAFTVPSKRPRPIAAGYRIRVFRAPCRRTGKLVRLQARR